ncbi:MAG: chorismate mutase [Salinivirgaceae bacterium]|jgi:chorismate mutase|nr:chorismate mutase [Salinivirgaceae bacterium]
MEQPLQKKKPIIIAGPCSAETREQVHATAHELSRSAHITAFRSGVWKPRSRPGSFEGIGVDALEWLKEVKTLYKLPLAVEVATPEHVEQALKIGVDYLWIGARTTSNPFSVQELATALAGCTCTVMIKNPVNPDIELWIGAIERFLKTGNSPVMAIHRGFYPYEETLFRNIPKWELPIELKTRMPDIPLICDPSHIAGNRELVPEVAQYALDLNFDGLMIESHIDPDSALSDARQQLTPQRLIEMLDTLHFRSSEAEEFSMGELDNFRNQIDSIDAQIIELLAQRMDVTRKIGEYKAKHNIAAFQLNRWKKIIRSRMETGSLLGLSKSFVKKMLQSVHKESIRVQSELMKQHEKK